MKAVIGECHNWVVISIGGDAVAVDDPALKAAVETGGDYFKMLEEAVSAPDYVPTWRGVPIDLNKVEEE